MRSEKNQMSTDQMNQKKRMNNNFQSKIQQILCVQGCKAISLCVSKYCKQPAFMCGQQRCICQMVHQKCSTKKLKGIIKTIELKLGKFYSIIQQNQRLINQRILQHKKSIQNLQLQIIKFRGSIQNQYMCGLSKCEKIVYKSILNKKQRTSSLKKPIKWKSASQKLKFSERIFFCNQCQISETYILKSLVKKQIKLKVFKFLLYKNSCKNNYQFKNKLANLIKLGKNIKVKAQIFKINQQRSQIYILRIKFIKSVFKSLLFQNQLIKSIFFKFLCQKK